MVDRRTIEELSEANLTVKEVVYGYLTIHPKATNVGLYKEFPNLNKSTLRGWRCAFTRVGLDAENMKAHLKWLYDLMATKIIKGLPPNEIEKQRLRFIESVIEDVELD